MDTSVNGGNNVKEVVAEKGSTKQQQSSWPSETILASVDLVNKIVEQKGSAKPVSRREISVITGKAEATLVMKLSSCVQYGLLESKFGQGYVPGAFYDKYTNPVFESDKTKVCLQMFANPDLYKRLINEYNGKSLPNETGLSNHLKSDFELNPNSAIKAAKIFFENCRDLNLIEAGNRLKFIIPESNGQNTIQPIALKEEQPTIPTLVFPIQDELFELPIPLPKGRKAFLRYPVDTLTKKDIIVISKALEFIASSLEEE